MNFRSELTVPKWPFFAADGVFVAAAALSLFYAGTPPAPGNVIAAILLLLVGALLALTPYVVEFYWNLQLAVSEREEQVELQRRELAKAGAEIDQLVGRWEELVRNSTAAAAETLKQQIEETTRGFQQWQTRLEEKEGKTASEFEKWLREEQKRRKEERAASDRVLERIESLRAEVKNLAATTHQETGRPPIEAAVAEPPPPPETPDPAPTAEPEPQPEPEPATVAAPDVPEETADGPTGDEGTKPVRKPRKVQVREENAASLFSTTTLVATAYIGAGNKLFLRGEGPGLSWEDGVPMQFVEIGKWSWTTTDAKGPIRLSVFKNDEEEDKAGILTLEPGQRLDVRPDFGG